MGAGGNPCRWAVAVQGSRKHFSLLGIWVFVFPRPGKAS
jgi:hypothetical protein